MEFLKEWVRGLVMLVILASCLEMLLPMNAMKKYVRMTMGLLVVLAVIQPILSFMGQTVTVTNLFPDDDRGSLPTISQIMSRAEQYREKNRTLALAQARTSLTVEAVQAARAVKGVADARADVLFTQEKGEIQVRSITVTITPGAGGSSGPAPVRPVKPVQPARPGADPASPAADIQPAARPPNAGEQAVADGVRREVTARLGLPASAAVTVLIEGR